MENQLPSHLINEVLLVLPVKSLLRFRCVSKSFNAIIMSKYFIYSHHNTSLERRIHRKLIHNYVIRSKIHALDINNGSIEEFPLDFEMPRISPWDTAYCNGLLLISTAQYSNPRDDFWPFSYKFSIWNPSTRHYRELPPFPEKIAYRPVYQKNHKMSFGYDPTRDDYKVVLIISTERMFQVWILELRSSYWRKIQDVPHYSRLGLVGFVYSYEQNCFADGSVHYMGYDPCTQFSILAFDIAKETFFMLPFPDYQSRRPLSRLQTFEGCLSIGLPTCTEHKVIHFYVRKKEGAEFSWIKLFSFTTQIFYPPCVLRILGYSNKGDKVLLSSGTNIIYSYDLKERSLQEIEMRNSGELYSVLCTESLVSVGSLI